MDEYAIDKAASYVTAIKLGAHEDLAAGYAGVDLATIRAWEHDRPDFRAEVEKARAEMGVAASGRIRQFAAEDWRASAFVAAETTADMQLARLRELTTDDARTSPEAS